MTNIDRKIKKLNKKFGRKTGIDFKDFKESVKLVCTKTYENKPIFYGLLVSNGLFIFTGFGFIASTLVGTATYFGTKKILEIKEKEGK